MTAIETGMHPTLATPAPRETARRFPVMAVLRMVALACLVAAVYREDCFRVAALDSGLLGLGLKVIRGIIIVHHLGVIWLLALLGTAWVLFSGRMGNKRLRSLRLLWIWLGFYVAQCALSGMGPEASSLRWERLFLYQLPVILPLFFLPVQGGGIRVRNWLFVAGVVQIAAIVVLRRLAGAGFSDLASTQESDTSRLIVQSDTITTSALLLQTALCAVNIIIDKSSSRWLRGGAMAALPFAAMLALLTGSRGPVVAFVGAILVLVGTLLLGAGRSGRTWSFFLVLLAVAGVVMFSRPMAADPAFERLTSAWKDLREGETEDETITIRLRNYQLILNSAPTVFGHGVGSFGAVVGDPGDYPHNIVLEAYYETGVAGLVLFGGMILIYLIQAGRALLRQATSERIFGVTLFVFYFGLNQFSGGFPASAMWACALILMVGSCRLPSGEPVARAEVPPDPQAAAGLNGVPCP